jgi:hypothetical protein
MAGVSEIIVREFFELHEFLLRQHRKYTSPSGKSAEDDDIDFFVLNPRFEPREIALPFVLESEDLRYLDRAVVVVKGWHTDTFSTARLTSTPHMFRFVDPKVFEQSARAFGADGSPAKILVVPGLPNEKQARQESIDLLRSKGVTGVILFRSILRDLVNKTETNRNYQKSDLLQIIRILKTYDLFKGPQLELFKPRKRKS